ncbi:MAG TPA: lysozyme inhibitor LprI family protein, partial [Acidobacteriaceae bacterium]|nr:lysozyme inhibitor LprI family protein [Acidobacteriaceae bacterium]
MSPMRAALSLLILALTSLASAQTFDCKLAQSPREKAVCSDTRLSALDAEIGANYKNLRARLSPESAALVQSDQREWLHWIDLVCPASGKGVAANQTQCLQNQYLTRAHDLAKDKIAPLGSTVIFPRSHFLFKPGNAPTSGPPVDPGFGYGSLRWPQID